MFYKAQFAVDDDTTFEGYTNGTRWNGYGVPYFTEDEARRVVDAYGADMPDAVEIDTEDGRITAYPVGAFEWTWFLCDASS